MFTRLSIDIKGFNLLLDRIDLENDEVIYERMNDMTNEYDIDKYRKQLKNEHLSAIYI